MGNTVTTYVRDAQGNVLAVYQQAGSRALQKIESHIYGSSRLGIAGKETTAAVEKPLTGGYQPARLITFTRGEKAYELTNHLGNVLVTISDKRLAAVSNGTITAYNADVISASDYYPFGMQMPGRTLTASNYRYGFNGKENDNEVKGDGNQQDYGERVYDPRTGRFYSVDPLAHKFTSWSPYNAMADNPISNTDPTGAAVAPIYDREGAFLGTDDQGLQGNAIVLDKKNFTQGMKHDDAVKKDLGVKALATPEAKAKYANSYYELPSRPDYDGFVTIQEGIDWAKSHVGALNNPTPENMLYLDASKLDFGNITAIDFKNGVGKSSPIQLNTLGNFLESSTNATLRATVYALGRVDMTLLDNNGSVSIVNDFNKSFNRATDYDWNRGGGFPRSQLIDYERRRAGLNDTHGFRTFYYGTGKLRPVLELPQPGTLEFEMVR